MLILSSVQHKFELNCNANNSNTEMINFVVSKETHGNYRTKLELTMNYMFGISIKQRETLASFAEVGATLSLTFSIISCLRF